MPDLYRGTEVWDLSLVDPDNRRPVDYEVRRHLLRDIQRRKPGRRLAADLWTRRNDGALKLYLTQRTLALREASHDLFATGDYIPLESTGRQSEHLCAFARRRDEQEVIVVVPRLVAGLSKNEPLGLEVWADTRILLPDVSAKAGYRNVLTDGIVTPSDDVDIAALAVADLFSIFPLALLVREGPNNH